MFVDWKRKKMRFMHDGKRITLRGLSSTNSHCPNISIAEIHQLIDEDAVAQIIELELTKDTATEVTIRVAIQEVIDQHQAVFAEPEGLPP